MSDNCKNLISDLENKPPPGKSDHVVITFKLKTTDHHIKSNTNPNTFLNYHKADFTSIKKYLSDIDWSTLSSMSVDDSWMYFHKVLTEAIKQFVPLTTKRKSKPPWFTKEISELINRKKKAYKRYIKNKAAYRYKIYKTVRDLLNKKIKEAIRTQDTNILLNVKNNPKKFWKFVKNKTKHKSSISELLNEDGTHSTTNQAKASTLNNHFAKVFSQKEMYDIPSATNQDSASIFFNNIIITDLCVHKRLLELKEEKSMGPDGIPAILLKNTADFISKPLSIIFNQSLSEGKLPSIWKTANVIPIFKKGDKTNPNNYRPISLTPICVKILEKILRDPLMNFLEDTNFFSESQFGFRKGRSCSSQLLEVMNDLSKYTEDKTNIDIIYFDFKKAFDTVPHKRLLYKLENAGLTGNILNWIKDFLKNRKQKVTIQSSESDEVNVLSGVPQGSILGPLFFLVFINDLPNGIKSNCKMFADDTKLYNKTENHLDLQQDINKLFNWSKNWQLDFNIDKCKILHFGRNNPKINYFMNGIALNKVTEEKDIGVLFDSTLEFKSHVKNVSSEASKLIGLIKRNFTYFNRDSLRTIITSLIRSKLEFANCIWSPIYKWQSSLLEKVQRRATKLLPCIKNQSYVDRLKYLNLTTLKYRRLRGDLIIIFNIINETGYPASCKRLIELSETNFTRNNYLKLKKNYITSAVRSHFLTNRVTNTWNNLSISCKKAKNTNQFKNLIDNELSYLRFDFDN